jgi:pimeloyl-ACP methyl ester carboxylesterase
MSPDNSIPKLDSREEHFFIPGPHAGLSLFARRLASATPPANGRRTVLYVHGATFPSALSIAHRFGARSWRDALCAAGFDVWGFDFYGFGHSDRYPEMSEEADKHSALGVAREGAEQLAIVARFILAHEGIESLSIISHSWGSMPVGLLAGSHPAIVDRWVLFAPISRRAPARYQPPQGFPAWKLISIEDQWKRFVEDAPAGDPPVLSKIEFGQWAQAYLDSDPESRTRSPPSVKTPLGPYSDIITAWQGVLAYDPARVRAPIAIIRGEWDALVPDEDARWLFDAFSRSPSKRDVKISRGTHLMHLETMRWALWRESIAFLLGGDVAPLPQL